jgi:uncharacterized membrane protein
MESNYQYPAAPEVRFGDWIGEGWRMFTEQWKAWVTITIPFFAAAIGPALGFVAYIYGVWMPQVMEAARRGRSAPPTDLLPAYLVLMGSLLLLMPVTVFLMGGMYRCAFKQLRGGRLEFKDIFSAGDCYFRLLGAVILIGLITTIGIMLCFVPGLLALGALYFTIPLIIDRKMGVIEAMKASYELTKPKLFQFALFAFVVQIIASAGSYACYIGLLATYPLLFTIHAVSFRDCFGVQGARRFTPQLPAPSIYAPPPMAQAPPPVPASVCPNCQTSLPPTAAFCPKCGAGVRR